MVNTIFGDEMKQIIKKDILKEILDDIDKDLNDEEILHLLLDKSFSTNSKKADTKRDKLADILASFGGSWIFIISFSVVIFIWMLINIFFDPFFDPYPFILLNLFLSCISSLQAPIIMMSQNRQEQKDRQKSDMQFKINVKNEIILQDLHYKLDYIIEQLDKTT